MLQKDFGSNRRVSLVMVYSYEGETDTDNLGIIRETYLL
jgi:hypothetical protein